MCGYIIARLDKKPWAYMLPIEPVFEDIAKHCFERTGGKVQVTIPQLPTIEFARNKMPTSDESTIPTPIKAVHTLIDGGSRAGVQSGQDSEHRTSAGIGISQMPSLRDISVDVDELGSQTRPRSDIEPLEGITVPNPQLNLTTVNGSAGTATRLSQVPTMTNYGPRERPTRQFKTPSSTIQWFQKSWGHILKRYKVKTRGFKLRLLWDKAMRKWYFPTVFFCVIAAWFGVMVVVIPRIGIDRIYIVLINLAGSLYLVFLIWYLARPYWPSNEEIYSVYGDAARASADVTAPDSYELRDRDSRLESGYLRRDNL